MGSTAQGLFSPATGGPPLTPDATACTDAVLVVEDDPTLGILMEHILGRAGRAVMRADDGQSALRLLAERGDEIALVIADCHLPDMDGQELCEQLRRQRPGVPVMLTSGRDHGALAAALAGGGPTEFLAKPFFPGEVVRRVNALLAAG